jgi:hypothetical protein
MSTKTSRMEKVMPSTLISMISSSIEGLKKKSSQIWAALRPLTKKMKKKKRMKRRRRTQEKCGPSSIG